MKIIGILLCATALAASAGPTIAAGKHPVASVSGRFAQRVVSGAPGSVVLYDQNTGDSGAAISSQNFGSDLDSYDDQAADDFVVPAGHRWRVKEVDVSGGYTEGAAVSQHITIYADHNGVPGNVVADCDGLHGTDNGGSFAIRIPKVCKIMLRSGTYWLAVVANQSTGQWLWEARMPIVGNEAVWQNPNGGWGLCNNWGTLEQCFGLPDDLMFTLKGRDRLK
ncbi:MAG: choice-of-anchor R domain-containing protein [Alphaproteobacteria bacterium]